MKNKVNIEFYNNLCSQVLFDDLFNNHEVKLSNAAQKHFKLLAEGLSMHSNVKVSVNSYLPINTYLQSKKFWKTQNDDEGLISYSSLPVLNYPLFRLLSVSFFAFCRIISKKKDDSESYYILVDYLRFSLNTAVILASKIRGFKTIAVVTDMPGIWISSQNISEKIRYRFKKIFKYDFYVFVTEESNRILNQSNKPYVVLESFVHTNTDEILNSFESKYQEKVLIYAGGIYEQYGIKNLIEAFLQIGDDNLRLWFFGSGSFVEQIKQFSSIDNRIVYKGLISNQELLPILTKATLLVNPRPTHGEYTKYSFPIKNMEFMSLGTPLITTNLPGIPNDHYPYIFLFEDDTVEGIKRSLIKVLSKDPEELFSFGMRSKQFVRSEKNIKVQAEKLLRIL